MTRFAVLVCLLGGCFLDTNHHEADDTVCNGGGVASGPLLQLRDPSTDVCANFGLAACDPECGPCPDGTGTGTGEGIAIPNWSECNGACAGLAEDACEANPTCHAAYTVEETGGPAGDGAGIPRFHDCWDIAPIAPITGGSCDALDADTCAAHPDCVSRFGVTFAPNDAEVLDFESCAAEADTHDPGSCDDSTIRCNIAPPACPANTVPGVDGACWSGYCIPTSACPPTDLACADLTTEAACTARPGDCEAEYTGMDCTCDAAGNCTCASETFDHCQDIGRL